MPSEPTRTLPTHFTALDSWRGVCALLVAAFHFPGEGNVAALPFIQDSRLFVDFFFTLSGFVIAANYLDRLGTQEDSAKFMWLRLGRLYPLHLAVLLAYLAVETFKAAAHFAASGGPGDAFTGERTLDQAVANLFLIQSLGLYPSDTWNLPSWSISCEIFTYLVFAALTVIGGKRWRYWLYAAAAALCLLVLALFSDLYFLSISRFGFFRCVAGFMAGVFAYRLFEAAFRSGILDRLGKGAWTVIELAAVALTVEFVWTTGIEPASFAAPLVFLFVVFVFAFERGAVSQAVKAGPLVYLGSLSYSIYMVHQFIFDRALGVAHFAEVHFEVDAMRPGSRGYDILGGSPAAADLMMAGALIVVVVTAHFTFKWIEAPCRDWSRRMLRDRFSKSHPAPEALRAER